MTTPALPRQPEPPAPRVGTSAECPHCGDVAHLSLLACPSFTRLRADRARAGGHRAPVRCLPHAAVRPLPRARLARRPGRIPSPSRGQMEQAPERFSYAHLPEKVAAVFREALACYSAGLLQAFAVDVPGDDPGHRRRPRRAQPACASSTRSPRCAPGRDRRCDLQRHPPRALRGRAGAADSRPSRSTGCRRRCCSRR